ncbi:metallophosphoesterase family protein [Lacticaseibacillus kribbianus]|uniref:metallophosphoesterase family protein n=1 Tax=Lacticaseibacillus kribbianus TaxID=2926292 RepID=UPI001CD3D468|nr:metallophosphoesterase [Lacticaseibacillus kribbianus]
MTEATLAQQVAAELLDYEARLDPSNFNVGVITDMHFDEAPDLTAWGAYPQSPRALAHLDWVAPLGNHVDAMIAGGDQTNGFEAGVAQTTAAYTRVMTHFFDQPTTADKFAIIGNHDDGSPQAYGRGYTTPALVMPPAAIQAANRTTRCRFGEQRDAGSLYWVKDYPQKRIRLIGLDTEDVDYGVVDALGHSRYNRWLWHVYRQRQLDWLCKTLAGVPAGYHVLVVGHCPLYYGWEDTGAHQLNHDVVRDILTAYALGSAFSRTVADADVGVGLGVRVACDFRAAGPRPLIGFIAGHTHEEAIVDLGAFKVAHLENDVCTAPSDVGTLRELAVTTVSVDTENRRVDLLGFGRASDRQFTY